MSFKANESQQISLNDAVLNLTERERKALKNSWAETFSEELFPAIDEKPFNVLYSGKTSRPNTPVTVIIGALIIKEFFDLSKPPVNLEMTDIPRITLPFSTTPEPG